MKSPTLHFLHLYPKAMNLYGDHGNILVLEKRCAWRGIKTKTIPYNPGDQLPAHIDLIFGGGGQDSGQSKIESDLKTIAPTLSRLISDGVPALIICGLYQLFGNYFETAEGQRISGANILNHYTIAGSNRLVGNITLSTPEFGEVVGYENHSGRTRLGIGATAFGTVTKGAGNNGDDLTEGIVYKNCIGTYLHGPILPKNPRVADFLIKKALEHKTKQSATLSPLDDHIERAAHQNAANRPR